MLPTGCFDGSATVSNRPKRAAVAAMLPTGCFDGSATVSNRPSRAAVAAMLPTGCFDGLGHRFQTARQELPSLLSYPTARGE